MEIKKEAAVIPETVTSSSHKNMEFVQGGQETAISPFTSLSHLVTVIVYPCGSAYALLHSKHSLMGFYGLAIISIFYSHCGYHARSFNFSKNNDTLDNFVSLVLCYFLLL
jgi:hypothetical protein